MVDNIKQKKDEGKPYEVKQATSLADIIKPKQFSGKNPPAGGEDMDIDEPDLEKSNQVKNVAPPKITQHKGG